MTESKPVLHVGIDLGTSRSSISASNGQRHVVESYVGWPLDMVARKVLKKPVLIGQEALDNRSMLDLHRPLEEGLIKDGSEKDEAAVRELLWHLLSLVGVARETRNGMKVRAVVGSVCDFEELPTAIDAMANRLTTGRTIVTVP